MSSIELLNCRFNLVVCFAGSEVKSIQINVYEVVCLGTSVDTV